MQLKALYKITHHKLKTNIKKFPSGHLPRTLKVHAAKHNIGPGQQTQGGQTYDIQNKTQQDNQWFLSVR